jgi:hypothetical protein
MGTAITGTQMRTLKASVVTELPDKGVSNKIYYVPNSTTGNNKYDEYIWIKDAEHPNGYFEKVGQKDINLEPYALTEEVDEKLKTKVDKVIGYGLSKNDFTDILKNKLDGIAEGAQVNSITGVKGSSEETYRTGNVSISASNIGLGNVNNTSDIDKPISIAQYAALDKKVDKVTGKNLSTNDFTDSYKTSLDNWFNRSKVNPTMSLSDLENKKDIPAGVYPINDGNQVWKYLIAFPRTKAGTASLELLANYGKPLKYRLYLKDFDEISPWKTLATTDVATSTADGLMSKVDKVSFSNLKSTNFSYIGANNINPFTATKTGVTLNYASYNSNLWGGKGINHSEAIPVASSTQAGIITAADKVKLDSLSPKEQLFIDMWNSACGTNGKYNAETGFYELNGLTDITYEQALTIYNEKFTFVKYMDSSLGNNLSRTNLSNGLSAGAQIGGLTLSHFGVNSKYEVFNFGYAEIRYGSYIFRNNIRLKKIMNACFFSGLDPQEISFASPNLEYLLIKLGGSINLSNLAKLTYETFDYIIKNSTNNIALTIKVHPTTYAYLQGTTPPTEQVGGTTEQWQALVTAATNKKISFATTE